MRVLRPNFEKRGGLVVAVAQDRATGRIMMVASADEKAFRMTLQTSFAHYYSTSREKLWKKGEESRSLQVVSKILVDCDGDAIIYVVDQEGIGACHTKAWSCFFRSCLEERFLMPVPNFEEKDMLPVIDVPVHPRFISKDGEA